MLRPRLKRTVDTVESASGDIFILRPGADSDLVIEQPDRIARELLAALGDGARSAAELEQRFGPERVRSALADLGEAALLEDAADDERIPAAEHERYDRQLRYFADLGEDAPASEYQRRIRSARIALLGVGGLGSWAAYALACCGVGELVLVDGDLVEESNFNRQILYRERDVGRSKVEAAVEALGAFNSACTLTPIARRLEGVDAIGEVIEGADFVVNAADWPAHDIERWANAACFAAGVAFITMSHAPPVARVGPLYAPGRTGCYACQEEAYRASHPLYDELVEQHRGRPSPAPTLGPVCAFIGGQVALEALHQVTGLCTPATLGAAHIYDLRTMQVTREAVPRLRGCPVCG